MPKKQMENCPLQVEVTYTGNSLTNVHWPLAVTIWCSDCWWRGVSYSVWYRRIFAVYIFFINIHLCTGKASLYTQIEHKHLKSFWNLVISGSFGSLGVIFRKELSFKIYKISDNEWQNSWEFIHSLYNFFEFLTLIARKVFNASGSNSSWHVIVLSPCNI